MIAQFLLSPDHGKAMPIRVYMLSPPYQFPVARTVPLGFMLHLSQCYLQIQTILKLDLMYFGSSRINR